MALLECAKPNLLRLLVPSKVAVEAIDLHPVQLALQVKKQQAKNVHHAKSAKNVPHVITMAIVKATIATIVAIAMTVTTATDAIAEVVTATIATAMVAITATTVVATAIMT
jgi:hypothetical protein